MKKYLKIIIAIIIIVPNVSLAQVPKGWNSTTTTSTNISPNRINGVDPTIYVKNIYATSTTATSTLSGAVTIGTGTAYPYLKIASSTTVDPRYGYLRQSLIDAGGSSNDYMSINVYNNSTGPCASADITANNDLADLTTDFLDIGRTGSGWTGVGCSSALTAVPANSGYIYDPTGSISMLLGDSKKYFGWFGGYGVANRIMTLTGAGNLGVGSLVRDYAQMTISTTTANTPTLLNITNITATTGDEARIDFTLSTGVPTNNSPAGGRISSVRMGSGAQADMYFSTNNPSAILKERLRLTKDGFAGIGTSTPTTLLQINNTTATSTISATVVNGSTRSTTIGGKIILQDMNGGTCTEITTQTGVISSRAVTCP